MDAAPAQPRVVAIVPIGALENAKSRLGGSLDAEERRDLVDAMIERTLAATTAARRSPRRSSSAPTARRSRRRLASGRGRCASAARA